jgi:hypothetical protein
MKRNWCVTKNCAIYADRLTEDIAEELAYFKDVECRYETDDDFTAREMTTSELGETDE